MELHIGREQRDNGGMEVSDVKKMKDMETELSQYKKIVAELTFENRAIKAFLEKK
jgi:putative transposase